MKAKQLITQLMLIIESSEDPDVSVLANGDLLEQIGINFDSETNKIVLIASEKR